MGLDGQRLSITRLSRFFNSEVSKHFKRKNSFPVTGIQVLWFRIVVAETDLRFLTSSEGVLCRKICKLHF